MGSDTGLLDLARMPGADSARDSSPPSQASSRSTFWWAACQRARTSSASRPAGKAWRSMARTTNCLRWSAVGIGEASLPIDHGAAPDAKHVSQFGLCQLELRAQGQHQLPKGVVSLAVRGPLHGRSLFVSFSQVLRCEGMCGAKVSRCPVTSSTLLSILQNRGSLAP